MIAPPAVVVHGVDDARRALAPGRPVTLLSAPGAALAGGCLWWTSLTRRARDTYPATDCADVLDCADAPGWAMAALRAGVPAVVLDRACPAFAAVAGAAASVGATVLDARPPALDLGERGALRRLADWLGAGRMDAAAAPPGRVAGDSLDRLR